MPTITVAGGDIFIKGKNVGSSYTSSTHINGKIVAHPPPAGETFLGWEGDTESLSNPSDELTDFALTSIDLSVSANTSDTPAAIGDSDFATLDAKLDLIYIDTQALRNP